MSTPMTSEVEVRRIVRRWQELEPAADSAAADRVRAFAQQLADATHRSHGDEPVPLPDLGPAVLIDQLRVTVHDAQQIGDEVDLAAGLTELRRTIG